MNADHRLTILALALVPLSAACGGRISELGTTELTDSGRRDTGAADGRVNDVALDGTARDSGDDGHAFDAKADIITPVEAASDVATPPVDAHPDVKPPIDAAPDKVTPPIDAAPDNMTPPVDAARDAPKDSGNTGDAPSDTSATTDAAADASPDADADPGPICPPDPANLPDEYAKVVCRKNTTCCSAANTSTCPSSIADAFRRTYPELSMSIQQGSASIDCDKYLACADAMLNACCTDWPAANGYYGADPVADVTACHEFVVPLLTTGQSCTQDYQCIDAYCLDDEGGNTSVSDRKCHTFIGEGGACAWGAVDAWQDKLCNPATHACNTVTGCTPRSPDDAACDSPNACTSHNCALSADGGQICMKPALCKYQPTPIAVTANCTLSARRRPGGVAYWLTAALALLALRRRRTEG